MSCLGVHFAITEELAAQFRDAGSDAELKALLQRIEEEWGGDDSYPWGYPTDKAWDAIHRCLTDGTLDPGTGPLRCFIAGGERLYEGDDYFLSLVAPAEAMEAAAAGAGITREWMRERYFAIDPDEYGMELTEDDFEYTWEYFQGLPAFFRRAGEAGRWVVFSVDQ